jgi:hypothetical protein
MATIRGVRDQGVEKERGSGIKNYGLDGISTIVATVGRSNPDP